MERLSVVGYTRKTDAKRRERLQELHRIKKYPSRKPSISKDRTIQPKAIPNLKNIRMTSLPSLKMSEQKVEYLFFYKTNQKHSKDIR